MKTEFPDITQTWYADDSGALGTFANVELYINLLKQFGPGRGYYPESSESIFIFNPDNIEAVKRFGFFH